MGRSSSSCLKIITCVSDTAADEDLDLTAPESKASSDRRKWSFRKRSGRHRVLSNTATSEALSVVYSKESPEASVDSFHSPNILPAPEKDHIEEPPPLSSTVSPLFVSPLITTEDEVKDSDAVIIQSAIRGYCAQRELLKLRNLVKLQAVVRGHLVRRQAAGTLRCVLAIVKMQALVRARQTRQINMERSSSSENGISSIKIHKTSPSTEKLLSNKFAHQLLESLPKTKHIPVKCDTSRSDSAWKWLERWMSVTASDSSQQDKQTEEDTKLAAYGAPTEALVPAVSISSELKSVPGEPNYDQDQSHLEDEGSDSLLPWQSNPKPSSKWASFEPQENEGDRPLFGSRKPLNPAFAAVQSKFEELSSASSLGRSANSESKSDSLIVNSVENSQSHEPRAQIAISECGTEISISSTLDSPDRSEAEAGEIVLEIGSPRNNDSPNLVSMDAEAKISSIEPEVHEPQVKQEPEEPTLSEMQAEMETPRSHVTVPDLHGTPSSQVSNNSKAKKGAKAIRKQRAELIGKRSPSTPKDDSGGPKDSKMGKKRNSFGTAKPDHVDSEPRISCSSSTLPSYMQATESARAKALASISPKSSPDVHDKDSYPRKRHSLPIAANGKQGSSPRMQRSASQAQQVPKANGTPSPNNSAERRWQR